MNKDTLAKSLLIAGVLLAGIVGMVYNQHLKSLPQKYCIGTITKVVKPVKGGKQAFYLYSIDGREYSNSINIGKFDAVATVGSLFVVSVPVDHRNSGVMLFDRPIPNGTRQPLEGWDAIPEF